MEGQRLRVGQTARVVDVREGLVTDVSDDGLFHLAGHGWMPTTLSVATRTITILSSPKPDEPKGLGAVVEDASGMLWVLAEPGERAPWRWLGLEGSGWRDWVDIDAVEVLFPGVEEKQGT